MNDASEPVALVGYMGGHHNMVELGCGRKREAEDLLDGDGITIEGSIYFFRESEASYHQLGRD
jgi:hypothetical protein